MFTERGTVDSRVDVVDIWDRMNEHWESKVEIVNDWDRMNEIWSERIGTAELKPEVVVDDWDQMNEIWSERIGTAESKPGVVVDDWDQMNEIWPERIGTAAGEKMVLMHDSPCTPLSKTNISDEVSRSDKEDKSWTSLFCSQRGKKFLCQVADHFILDDFNLCGLSKHVPYYHHALDLILNEESSSHEEQRELIESAAEMLYGMIHARFLPTFEGLRCMLYKYYNHEFGRCPRVYCHGQPCLPIGLSDIPRESTVKMYCPKCEDVYDPRSEYHGNIDGAYFGTSFPHLFLLTYEHLKPQKAAQSYVPKVFGFKLHKP